MCAARPPRWHKKNKAFTEQEPQTLGAWRGWASRSEGALSSGDRMRLERLHTRVHQANETFLGYPSNTLFDYSPLYGFLKYPLNNIGDPYTPGTIRYNTHEFEREVVATFARFTRAPNGWVRGYVTNGGTEGNMYGLWLARELLPRGTVYFSEDTHYSIAKIVRCLRMPGVKVRSLSDGRMDLRDLRERLAAEPGAQPILLANIGTTMKGAIDDLEGIRGVLDQLGIRDSYIHADAALSGMILPFVDEPPPWDFSAGVASISVSGHKMIGAPIPCGVVLAKKANVERIAQGVEYVASLDTTLAGSRNALTPLFLWYALRTVSPAGFKRRVEVAFEVADYAIARLRNLGLNAWRHKNSVTVVFERPSPALVAKWQLAVEENITHIMVMPQITRERIDLFLADLELDSLR